MTVIISCSCIHPDQDSMYGNGHRLANECNSKMGGKSYRCTVCGKTVEGAKKTK